MNENGRPELPYKGLSPYLEEDAARFFGRDADRKVIASNLIASRLTVLYGPSGVGKSSVLRAGVARDLDERARAYVSRGRPPRLGAVVFGTWKDDPSAGLQDAIGEALSNLVGPDAAAPPEGSSLATYLRAWAEAIGGSVLIVLDQFEEFLLYHLESGDRNGLATELAGVLADHSLRANVLISIREDALARLDQLSGSIPDLFANRLPLAHLDEAGARDAITKPIDWYLRAFGDQGQPTSIEAGLIERVIADTRPAQIQLGEGGRAGTSAEPSFGPVHAPVETPYLQLIMTRLWDAEVAAGSSELRLTTLSETLGGTRQIVQDHLNATMHALSEREQAVAAKVFHHLVTPGGSKFAQDARDLAEYAELPADEVTPVLDKLSRGESRILTPVPTRDRADLSRYEISHDALGPAMLEWRLERLRREGEDRIRREEERHRERERAAAARRLRRTVMAAGGATLVLLVVLALLVVAVLQLREAETQRKIATSRHLAADARAQLPIDPELSVLLAREAVRTDRTVEAEAALTQALAQSHVRAALRGHTGPVTSASFSPDGRQVLTVGDDGTARVWDAAGGTPAAELRGHTGSVISASFSPDGRQVVTASADGTARVWDGGRGTVADLRGHTGKVNSIDFSPDGRQVVTASEDGTARVWDAATGSTLTELRGQSGPMPAAAFSQDGKHVVTVSRRDSTPRLWNASTGALVADLYGRGGPLRQSKIGADGRRMVTMGTDGVARIWDTASGSLVTELRGVPTLPILVIVFDPDGRQVLIGGPPARVWDASSGNRVTELQGISERMSGAAFRPDGQQVVISTFNGPPQVWDHLHGNLVTELRGHSGAVNRAEFSPDGQRIVTAGADGTARIWDAASGQQVAELRGHTGTVRGAYFREDGAFVLTTSADETVRLWRPSSGMGINVAVLPRQEGAPLCCAEFSPDGQRVLVGRGEGAQIFACETCVSLDQLQMLASTRVTRELTPEERARYLHEAATPAPSPGSSPSPTP